MTKVYVPAEPETVAGRSRRTGWRGRRWRIGVAVALPLSLVAYGTSVYGFQPLRLEDAQRAAMSKEGGEYVASRETLVVPDLVTGMITGRQAVLDGQRRFAEAERPVEDGIIRRYGLRLENTTIAGVPVTIVTPPAVRPGNEDAIAINIHGGGFVYGSARDRVGLLMAHDLGIKVYSIDYTLSPQAAYPVAINESLRVYRDLVGRFDPRRIVGFSSSSGGNLMLATLLQAERQGLPMIAGLGLFTPATDISGAGDSGVFNDGRDGLAKNMAMSIARRHYAPGMDFRAPGLSPLYAGYSAGFPPTTLVSGTRDLFLSNAVRQYWKLDSAGVDAELLVSEGLGHGFHWEPDLPEAVQVRRAVSDFLAERLGEEPSKRPGRS
ncbi:hypothetical protein GCM10022252_32980 [Streptosporangium oxazolinicum]|uniref:Alpha/beta hydrolase fold-3 domain-containing protein n=1 Tax=Streptosporangium oxazolinicum TaxID=909287 RepID=A0ABP8AWF9_9ACTN